jgi:hypothetical protein
MHHDGRVLRPSTRDLALFLFERLAHGLRVPAADRAKPYDRAGLSVVLRSPGAVATVAVKAALVGLLIFAVARPDLPQFAGKAMTGRAIAYPLAALVVPAIWWFVRRRSPTVQYPYALDVLVVLPFLIDTAGNAANLYDTVDWWDDANHFVNWALLVAGFGQLLVRLPYGRVVSASLAIGFGAVTAILWEFLEYVTFIRHSKELRTAYTDTLGDLALGLAGSVLAAVVTVTLLWRRRRPAASSL